jgi:hypothetical protein
LNKYLKRAAIREDMGSIYKVAQYLGVAPNTLYRAQRKGGLADEHCVRIAELLRIEPIEVLAAKQADRASSDALREVWLDVVKKTTTVSGQPRAADMMVLRPFKELFVN